MRNMLVVATSALKEDHKGTIEAENADNRDVERASFVFWP